jgi:hypothetical protein
MLGGQRPDDYGIGLAANSPQLIKILQIQQMLRLGQSELHHRDEAVSAGNDPGILAVLRQEADGLVQRSGPMVLEWRGYHSRLLP